MSYLLIENTPGCLPEYEPIEYESIADGVAYVEEFLAPTLEEFGFKLESAIVEDEYAQFYFSRHDNDLGRVVEIFEDPERGPTQ